MPTADVWLDEIFLSLQGEAGEVGRSQIFLRLGGCPLRCDYCDTPRSWQRGEHYERHDRDATTRGRNPLDAARLEAELARVAASHGVDAREIPMALTGGEPLEQVDFLAGWLPGWPAPVMLETAGIWPERLARLLPYCAQVSLDWKLAGALRAGGELAAAAECARLLHAAGSEGWVKIVVGDDVDEAELAGALDALAAAAPGIRCFLQPATPVAGGPRAPSAGRLLAWSLASRRRQLDLRVLPQVHPLMGAR